MAEFFDENDSHKSRGGSIPGAPGKPAFTLFERAPSTIPVLIAVPHAGRTYPRELLAEMRQGAAAALRLEDRYVDRLARDVVRATGASLLLAEAPRAMVDLNRGPDDVDWEMFLREARPAQGAGQPSRRVRGGLGLIPRRLPMVGELWRRRFTAADLTDRIAGIHEPYHAALAQVLGRLRERWGAALLIDLHSMPPLASRPGVASAQIVVGDRFGATCHGSLVAASFAHLAQVGREAAHNRPYAGGYVLERHGDPRNGIHAMQIEIDRSRYLDEAMVEVGPGLEAMVMDIAGLVLRLADGVVELGRGSAAGQWGVGSWPLAAE